MIMETIQYKIKNCSECPFCGIEKVYTPDSFDNVVSWKCNKKKGKEISGYLETFDRLPKIPDWCPAKITK